MKQKPWGGNVWSAGYFVATVNEHGNEKTDAKLCKDKVKNTPRCIDAKLSYLTS